MFKGNQSRKFLKSVPMLETLLMSEGPQEIRKGVPYIKVLSLFDKVVDTCFGMTLKPKYEEAILAFKEPTWSWVYISHQKYIRIL